MYVTVFGGAQPRQGQPTYEAAIRLGKLLGDAGHTVLTGGYLGTMEAVSRGAAEAGAHVIGVTCEEIEAWRPVRANAWVKEEKRVATLRERIYTLIDLCDAAIALPGGPGTLAEIAVMWNHLLTRAIHPRALILVGFGWQATFNQFIESHDEYIPLEQRHWLRFAPDVETAVGMLDLPS
jgi:hypothetical protein